MPLSVTMQSVVLANVSQLRIKQNPDTTFTGTAEYVVVDQFGVIWKNSRCSFPIAGGSTTLNQMVTAMLTAINQQEGTG